jgi:hypothetical protein
MTVQRAIIYITGVFIAVGFAVSQAGAQELECKLSIEINALRGGSPTVTEGGTKDITAKARIQKGSAMPGTTIDMDLTIEAFDGAISISRQFVPAIQIEIGKGGKGKKLRLNAPICDSGSIDFVATFSGTADNGALCEVTETINKTCKYPAE